MSRVLEKIILHESRVVWHAGSGKPYRVIRGIGVRPVFHHFEHLLAWLPIPNSISWKYHEWLNSVLTNVSKKWLDDMEKRAKIENSTLREEYGAI